MADTPDALTFLFTDVASSTTLWERYPDEMRLALAWHDAVLRNAIQHNGGAVFKTMGDAFYAVFPSAAQGVAAAVDCQRGLSEREWPQFGLLRVRIALHCGPAEQRDGDYFGGTLNRIARLIATAHGGQVLLSSAAREMAADALPPGCSLLDLGSHRLKDLQMPEHAWQLVHPDLDCDFPPLRSLQAFASNLPLQLTTFIGREREMADVKSLLGSKRLLTITGPGGCGKTRLAIQVAADVVETYPDGVWLAELAPLTDASLVDATVAAALGVTEQPGIPIWRSIADYAGARRMLLILDNAEHVLSSAAHLAESLLTTCHNVQILSTSREPLRIAGEQIYPIPSLGMPAPDDLSGPGGDPVAIVSGYDSCRLFLERATQSAPDFRLDHRTAPAVATICRRLDGLPLALELAAARVRSLPVEQLTERLDQRFRLLTGGSRTAMHRHQTLRALIDWSYELLSDAEQTLMNRLSVFAGGWDLEATEAVCAGGTIDSFEIADLLGSLVDRSLVFPENREGAMRYRLLESVRDYARERLAERGESDTTRERHRDYFVQLAEAASSQFVGPDRAHWLKRVDADHDNVRAALDLCLEAPDSEQKGLRIAGALQFYWVARQCFAESRARTSALLARDMGGATRSRAMALHAAGNLAHCQSDYPAAKAFFEDALVIQRQLGNRKGVAAALGSLGNVAQYQGDYAAARALFEESLEINREVGNRLHEAANLTCLGSVSFEQADYAAAEAFQQQALPLNRELGNLHSVAINLNALGLLAQARGESEAAERYYRQAMEIYTSQEDHTGEAIALHNLGALAVRCGDLEAARPLHRRAIELIRPEGGSRLLAAILSGSAALLEAEDRFADAAAVRGAIEALREAIGSPEAERDRSAYDEDVRKLKAKLGVDGFTEAWAAGRALTPDQAADFALGSHSP